MLFKKIALNNIGPYEGVNEFTFTSSDGKNCTLIGGNNGAGKTTLLTSVRLALYGPLAYGFKTESNDYMKKISALLNSKALKKNEGNFNVQLDFSMVENFKRVNISIIRSWLPAPKGIKEKVAVIREKVHLDEVKKDLFFEDLRTSFPPSLLELCLFDGEEITQLTSEDNLSNYLQELSTKIFNLDLFQSLEQDLTSYVSQSSRSKEEAKLEEERNLLSDEIKQKIDNLSQVDQLINDKHMALESMNDRYKSVKNDFALHGGLAMEEREKVQQEINSVEGQRKHIGEQIKDFIAKDLPFFIALPRLVQLVEQLKSEEDFHVSNILVDKINNLPMDDIIKNLGIESNDSKREALKSDLTNRLATVQQVSIIHNASKTEAQQVYSLLSTTNVDKLNTFGNLISENKELLYKIQRLKKQLKDNDASPEFENMIIKMEEYNKEIAELENELSLLANQKHEHQEDINTLNNKYERVKHSLFDIQKTKSSFDESQKIINISKRFQEKQLRNKVKDVEYFSSKMFKDLLRKKEFINQIQINPKDFKLRILDSNNEEINKDILSAGEKELLVLSVIWGTIAASKKELPFILDTLLGRLDREHKSSIVSKLIPKFGVQTIILSTDSEIDEQLYNSLSNFIANKYTLNYDTINKRTHIEPHFFHIASKKVNS
ncbi:DNA sulfur modification protein DndD [Sediminibacillus massiliensis]|uniref:DNA sulfur modification protein DndD n=1 Tax=Sediminibacillus massiliensis TaxID=1926277 RepID=UPI0009885CF0|nr:DNA sulfur modification protein DndD [Sediminibacillus massiliensis]